VISVHTIPNIIVGIVVAITIRVGIGAVILDFSTTQLVQIIAIEIVVIVVVIVHVIILMGVFGIEQGIRVTHHLVLYKSTDTQTNIGHNE
jgi:choline-glycine betaine transporter